METTRLALALLLAAAARAQSVLVVGPVDDPAAHFHTIQDALGVALPGDTVLVLEGNYTSAFITRGVTLVADAGAQVLLEAEPLGAPISIGPLPPNETVVVHGLQLHLVPGTQPAVIGIGKVPGPVWIEDCTISGGRPAVHVSDSPHVVLVRCPITAEDSVTGTPSSWVPAGRGLEAFESDVTLFECIVLGGDGGDALQGTFLTKPRVGGDGAQLSGSILTLVRSSLQGGTGGDGLFDAVGGECVAPMQGGSGVEMRSWQGSEPLLRLLQSTALAAPSGSPGAGCAPIDEVPDIDDDGFPVQPLPGDAPRLASLEPVREGEIATLQITGTPGALLWLDISNRADTKFLPGFASSLATGQPLLLLNLGVVPPSGTLTLAGAMPQLPAGMWSLLLFLQVAQAPSPGNATLGSPAALVLLDETI